MKSDNTFINSFGGAQPPNSQFDTLSPWRMQKLCVCVCVDQQVSLQCVFMLIFKEGRSEVGGFTGPTLMLLIV